MLPQINTCLLQSLGKKSMTVNGPYELESGTSEPVELHLVLHSDTHAPSTSLLVLNPVHTEL